MLWLLRRLSLFCERDHASRPGFKRTHSVAVDSLPTKGKSQTRARASSWSPLAWLHCDHAEWIRVVTVTPATAVGLHCGAHITTDDDVAEAEGYTGRCDQAPSASPCDCHRL
jgi:hypothetical protein